MDEFRKPGFTNLSKLRLTNKQKSSRYIEGPFDVCALLPEATAAKFANRIKGVTEPSSLICYAVLFNVAKIRKQKDKYILLQPNTPNATAQLFALDQKTGKEHNLGPTPKKSVRGLRHWGIEGESNMIFLRKI